MGACTMQIRNGYTTSKKQHLDSLATITCISCSSSNASLAQIKLKCRFGKTIILCNEFVEEKKKHQGAPVLSQRYTEERSGVLSPLSGFTHPEGGKTENCRVRHSVAVFFL